MQREEEGDSCICEGEVARKDIAGDMWKSSKFHHKLAN